MTMNKFIWTQKEKNEHNGIINNKMVKMVETNHLDIYKDICRGT